MAIHVVRNDDGTEPGPDRAEVETLLAEAAALADMIACASVSPAQPSADSTALAAQSLRTKIERIQRELFRELPA